MEGNGYLFGDEIDQCRALLGRRQHTTLSEKEERACWQRIRQRVETLHVMAVEWSGWSPSQIICALDEMTLDENEDIIIEAYMPFAWSIALKIWRYPLSFSDLFQEGILGLIRAMRRYDYRRCIKFSTYATDWVHAEIIRFLDNHARTIRIPVNQLGSLKRCWRQGDDWPFEEIAHAVPLEDMRGDWDEWLNDPSANFPEDIIFGSECAAYIRQRVALLTNPHEREVVELLYGLREDGVALTFREIGPRLGITHAGVMERKKRALRRLRDETLKELLKFF